MTQLAYCGLDCGHCDYRPKNNCPGCQAAAGKMFWGQCALATCCIGKKLEHCGKCDLFPCEQLKDFSYDKKKGAYDGRIENLKAAKQQKS